MAVHEWWQRGVFYQIYPRSFYDANGDGIGDLQGIIDKLDYLKDTLGIDALWISPFYPSPMADFGYDVADYTDVDPMFGDLATFDRLVAAAHARGIKITIDYVPNHSSDEHVWFKASRSSRDNPKRDWYIWRDAKPDGGVPNNWGSMFGGDTWTWDEHTGQYYFHQFDPKQPDLNWRNPEVRAAMLDVLRFWMKRGVDGFRMDVVYVIWKHPDMPDQPYIEGLTGRGEGDRFSRQQQIYALNYEGVHEVMREIREVLDEHDAVGIAELWLPVEERMKYYGTVEKPEFHIPFNFDLMGAMGGLGGQWHVDFFRSRVEALEAAVPAHGFPNYVLGNHDVPRLASRLGSEARARVAAMLLLTLRGTPTMYAGDELGMVNGEITAADIQDPQGKLLGVEHTRDVTRTPFQWDDTGYAGFSTMKPWLPVHSNYPQRNVTTLLQDDRSILNLYRLLLAYRKEQDSLSVGDYHAVDAPDGVYAYLRGYGDMRHLILLNFTGDAVLVPVADGGTVVISTWLDRDEAVTGSVDLRGDEGVIVRLD